jgi:hypothetical protein
MDVSLFLQIFVPFGTAVIGAYLTHYFENKPKLIAYLVHAAGVKTNRDDQQQIAVHFHTYVVRNAGKKTATNVRLGHATLPGFQVFPDIEYSVGDLPGGGKEILIPSLIPGKQIFISYVYFPPLTWNQINTHIESDSGAAKVINVLPTPQSPKWVIRLFLFLVIVGATTLVYLMIMILRKYL